VGGRCAEDDEALNVDRIRELDETWRDCDFCADVETVFSDLVLSATLHAARCGPISYLTAEGVRDGIESKMHLTTRPHSRHILDLLA
jgi:hypothetical protein